MRYVWLAATLACTACGDRQLEGRPVDARLDAAAPVIAVVDATPPDSQPDASTSTSTRIEPWRPGDDAASEAEALLAIHAMPVWDAVVERGRYLARRGQRGVLHGRLGPLIASDRNPAEKAAGHDHAAGADAGASTDAGPGRDAGPGADARPDLVAVEPPRYVWLIDDSEGAGTLGIRLAGRGLDSVQEGERVIVWGAWRVDGERTWYWQAERIATLIARPDASPPSDAAPGHTIAALAAQPGDAQPVSTVIPPEVNPTAPPARRPARPPEPPPIISFEITQVPVDPASGWPVADQSRDPPLARLFLPGERATYGAQDMRSPHERWRLFRGVRYLIVVDRVLPGKPGELARIIARGAPSRITARGARLRPPTKDRKPPSP